MAAGPQPDDDVDFEVPTSFGPVRLFGVVIGVGDRDLTVLMPSGQTRLVPLADLRAVRPYCSRPGRPSAAARTPDLPPTQLPPAADPTRNSTPNALDATSPRAND